jgi:hypothetical protein
MYKKATADERESLGEMNDTDGDKEIGLMMGPRVQVRTMKRHPR